MDAADGQPQDITSSPTMSGDDVN